MELSREKLARFTRESVDPTPLSRVVRSYDNLELTDEELSQKIEERNEQRKPTHLLRLEYERRLKQRGL